MRLPTSTYTSLIPVFLLPALSSAISINCDPVTIDDSDFTFSKLSGPKSVSQVQEEYPLLINRTFTLDICKPLRPDPSTPKEEGCPTGTNVCGIETVVNADNLTLTLTEILPIAGAYNTSNTSIGGSEWTRLKASDTSEAHEGVRLRIHGGRANGRKQHAVIDMLCIREPKRRDGSNEEVIRRTDDKIKRDEKDDDDEDGDDRRPGEEKKKQWEELLTTDDGAGGTIHFISYEREKAEGVLRLEWKTKYACEDAADDDDDGSPSGGWGIFSWFFFLAFMGLLIYLIASCYFNYTRYGARGVDLLPHGDTLQDLPYIIRDFFRKIVQTFQGGGSRGGYSAV